MSKKGVYNYSLNTNVNNTEKQKTKNTKVVDHHLQGTDLSDDKIEEATDYPLTVKPSGDYGFYIGDKKIEEDQFKKYLGQSQYRWFGNARRKAMTDSTMFVNDLINYSKNHKIVFDPETGQFSGFDDDDKARFVSNGYNRTSVFGKAKGDSNTVRNIGYSIVGDSLKRAAGLPVTTKASQSNQPYVYNPYQYKPTAVPDLYSDLKNKVDNSINDSFDTYIQEIYGTGKTYDDYKGTKINFAQQLKNLQTVLNNKQNQLTSNPNSYWSSKVGRSDFQNRLSKAINDIKYNETTLTTGQGIKDILDKHNLSDLYEKLFFEDEVTIPAQTTQDASDAQQYVLRHIVSTDNKDVPNERAVYDTKTGTIFYNDGRWFNGDQKGDWEDDENPIVRQMLDEYYNKLKQQSTTTPQMKKGGKLRSVKKYQGGSEIDNSDDLGSLSSYIEQNSQDYQTYLGMQNGDTEVLYETVEYSPEDVARAVAVIPDAMALALSFSKNKYARVASTTLGVIGSTTRFGLDLANDDVSWLDALKNYGINLGLDVGNFFGSTSKYKSLQSSMRVIGALLGTVAIGGTIQNGREIWSAFTKLTTGHADAMTPEDWELLYQGLAAASQVGTSVIRNKVPFRAKEQHVITKVDGKYVDFGVKSEIKDKDYEYFLQKMKEFGVDEDKGISYLTDAKTKGKLDVKVGNNVYIPVELTARGRLYNPYDRIKELNLPKWISGNSGLKTQIARNIEYENLARQKYEIFKRNNAIDEQGNLRDMATVSKEDAAALKEIDSKMKSIQYDEHFDARKQEESSGKGISKSVSDWVSEKWDNWRFGKTNELPGYGPQEGGGVMITKKQMDDFNNLNKKFKFNTESTNTSVPSEKCGGHIMKYKGGTGTSGVQVTDNALWDQYIGNPTFEKVLEGLKSGSLDYNWVNTMQSEHAKLYKQASANDYDFYKNYYTNNDGTIKKYQTNYKRFLGGNSDDFNLIGGISNAEGENIFNPSKRPETDQDNLAAKYIEDDRYSGKTDWRRVLGRNGDLSDAVLKDRQKQLNDIGYDIYLDEDGYYKLKPLDNNKTEVTGDKGTDVVAEQPIVEGAPDEGKRKRNPKFNQWYLLRALRLANTIKTNNSLVGPAVGFEHPDENHHAVYGDLATKQQMENEAGRYESIADTPMSSNSALNLASKFHAATEANKYREKGYSADAKNIKDTSELNWKATTLSHSNRIATANKNINNFVDYINKSRMFENDRKLANADAINSYLKEEQNRQLEDWRNKQKSVFNEILAKDVINQNAQIIQLQSQATQYARQRDKLSKLYYDEEAKGHDTSQIEAQIDKIDDALQAISDQVSYINAGVYNGRVGLDEATNRSLNTYGMYNYPTRWFTGYPDDQGYNPKRGRSRVRTNYGSSFKNGGVLNSQTKENLQKMLSFLNKNK